jgi:hypothetical protein
MGLGSRHERAPLRCGSAGVLVRHLREQWLGLGRSEDLATDVKVQGHEFTFRARSVQLGTRGMSLEHADQLSLAQPVELTFALPSGSCLRVGAVVWWKKDSRAGVRFDPREDYRAIEEWIECQSNSRAGCADSTQGVWFWLLCRWGIRNGNGTTGFPDREVCPER